MSREDAEAVRKLHKDKHGVDGMAFLLDCMHMFWKNCPVAWQGMFQGQKGKPTIICEAGVDYNGWFWHFKSRFPGTMNDKMIWGHSLLHQALEQQTFKRDINPEEPFYISTTNHTTIYGFSLMEYILTSLILFTPFLCLHQGQSHILQNGKSWHEKMLNVALEYCNQSTATLPDQSSCTTWMKSMI